MGTTASLYLQQGNKIHQPALIKLTNKHIIAITHQSRGASSCHTKPSCTRRSRGDCESHILQFFHLFQHHQALPPRRKSAGCSMQVHPDTVSWIMAYLTRRTQSQSEFQDLLVCDKQHQCTSRNWTSAITLHYLHLRLPF